MIYRHKNAKNKLLVNTHNTKKSAILLAGLDLDEASNQQSIRRYVKETDDTENFFRRKKKEIDDRDMPITEFGELTNVDVDEIALTVQKIQGLDKVWIKFVKNKNEINKQTDIYKILYGLTLMAIKAKDPRLHKPPQPPIKKLTQRLAKKLPKKKGRTTLEKDTFINEFAKMLYKIHEEMVTEESNLL